MIASTTMNALISIFVDLLLNKARYPTQLMLPYLMLVNRNIWFRKLKCYRSQQYLLLKFNKQ